MTAKDELELALQHIAELEGEIAQLRAEVEDNTAAAELRTLLAQLGAVSILGASDEHSDVLEHIVKTAMHVLLAQAGSLYLVDESSGELVFEVALGEHAAPLCGQHIPLGQGIAGWVAVSGQAISVADVQQDPLWADEVARTVGYVPRSMLATPLYLRDNVIGVLQLLDKDDGQAFSAADIATLGMFAQQAAVTIEHSRSMFSLSALFRMLLCDQDREGNLVTKMTAFVASTEASAEYHDILKLARLLGMIAHHSDSSRRMCIQIAEAIVNYLHPEVHSGESHRHQRGVSE